MDCFLGMVYVGGANLEKQANWAINILLIICVIAIFWILWSALGKRTEQENFTRGASKNETAFEIHEYPFSFPCGKFITYDPSLGGKPRVTKK